MHYKFRNKAAELLLLKSLRTRMSLSDKEEQH